MPIFGRSKSSKKDIETSSSPRTSVTKPAVAAVSNAKSAPRSSLNGQDLLWQAEEKAHQKRRESMRAEAERSAPAVPGASGASGGASTTKQPPSIAETMALVDNFDKAGISTQASTLTVTSERPSGSLGRSSFQSVKEKPLEPTVAPRRRPSKRPSLLVSGAPPLCSHQSQRRPSLLVSEAPKGAPLLERARRKSSEWSAQYAIPKQVASYQTVKGTTEAPPLLDGPPLASTTFKSNTNTLFSHQTSSSPSSDPFAGLSALDPFANNNNNNNNASSMLTTSNTPTIKQPTAAAASSNTTNDPFGSLPLMSPNPPPVKPARPTTHDPFASVGTLPTPPPKPAQQPPPMAPPSKPIPPQRAAPPTAPTSRPAPPSRPPPPTLMPESRPAPPAVPTNRPAPPAVPTSRPAPPAVPTHRPAPPAQPTFPTARQPPPAQPPQSAFPPARQPLPAQSQQPAFPSARQPPPAQPHSSWSSAPQQRSAPPPVPQQRAPPPQPPQAPWGAPVAAPPASYWGSSAPIQQPPSYGYGNSSQAMMPPPQQRPQPQPAANNSVQDDSLPAWMRGAF